MTKSQLQKHLGTKLTFELETFMMLFTDLDDNQRLELIKSLIWTSIDAHAMHKRVVNAILNPSFEKTLD